MKNISLLGLIVLSICSLGMTGAVNPQPDTVIVPNVEGVTIEVAAKMLQTMGLQPLFRSSAGPSAIVVWQDPRPGVSLSVGGEVGLSTGTLPQTTTTTNRNTGFAVQACCRAPTRNTRVEHRNTDFTIYAYCRAPTRDIRAEYWSESLCYAFPETPQGKQVLAYSISPSGSQSQILYQPLQPPHNRYVVADTTPRFYPAWYPKKFLTLVNPPTASSVTQSESMRITVQATVPQQIPVSPYGAPNAAPQAYPDSNTPKITTTTSTVPIPYLVRLYQQDAITAITKAGLAIGNIIRVQSAQVGAGIVVRQSPQPRALVPAGTAVNLWVAY